MQTRTKESKKRLHSLILLTAFTAVLLIVSTYAWFTTQKSVSIANIRGIVQVAEGLEISLDGEKWTQSIDLGDTEHVSLTAQEGVTDPTVYSKLIYKPYATHENNVPSEFKPVSSSGETFVTTAGMTLSQGVRDKMIMMAGTYDGEKLRNVNLTSDAGGDYFAFDVFIRNSSKTGSVSDVLQLNHTSSAWVSPDGTDPNDPALVEGRTTYKGNPLYGIQNSIRVGFARYGAAAGIDPELPNEQQDPTVEYFIDADASPEDIISKSDAAKITGVSIWEPNANAHSKYAVDNTRLIFDKVIGGPADPTQTIYLTSETGNKFFTKTLNFASIGKITDDGIDVFDWDNGTEPYASTLNYLHTTQTRSLDGTIKNNLGEIIKLDERFPMIEDGIQNLKLVTTNTSPNLVNIGGATVNINDAAYNFKELETEDLTIAANSITKFRIYVWIEGQDPDCTNYASSGGGIEVNLSICKGEKEGDITSSVPTDDRVTTCLPGKCKDLDPANPDDERDGLCYMCGSKVACSAGGFECVEDKDNRDGKCDLCGLPYPCDEGDYPHVDNDPKDARCDYCGEEMACAEGECIDEEMYDDQGAKVPGHDGLCDICNKAHTCDEYDRDCIDAEDTKFGHINCDICDKELTCQDLDESAVCVDHYDNAVPTTPEPDGACDKCGKEIEQGN